MRNTTKPKAILSDLFSTALHAVKGSSVVEKQLQSEPIVGNVAVLAIGKAAASMMYGAQNQLKDQIQSSLIITKKGFCDPSLECFCIESGHPIPDETSLEAGDKLLKFIHNIPKDYALLALVSGGASALVELLPANVKLEDLQKINEWLLSSGLEISEMNKVRQSVSLIKAGRVLNHLNMSSMTQFLISDVKNDDISIIGSGLFVVQKKSKLNLDVPDWIKKYKQTPEIELDVLVKSNIVANNEMACQAIITHAKENNYAANYYGQSLYGDVFELAARLAKYLLSAEQGIHVWGGEPTIVLPTKTGRGGRSQSLALALACILENEKGITILVGATDGNDGSTDDAGAIIDGSTLQRGNNLGAAKDYLTAADAGTYLNEAGDLLSTGATGTNVMDIVIALKEPNLAAS